MLFIAATTSRSHNTFFITALFRGLDRELKSIERRQGLKNRWNEHCVQFEDALREFEDKRKLSLLVKARSEAMERMFHIALKRKYSGYLEFDYNFLCALLFHTTAFYERAVFYTIKCRSAVAFFST